MSSKTLVISHGLCNDGFTASWVASKALPKDTEFVQGFYGQDPPDVEGKDVYILDFSYPRDVLLEMKERANSLLVIDHHKTAQANLEGLDFCKFDMNHSGARLTWNHFEDVIWPRKTYITDKKTGEKSELWNLCPPHIPTLIHYVEDRDMWWNRMPSAKEVTAVLMSYEHTFSNWDRLAGLLDYQPTLQELVKEGEAILRYQEQQINLAVERAAEVVFTHPLLCGGYVVPTVNSSVLFSEIAGRLAEGRAFGACWFRRQDGLYQYSLRSTEHGIDVSEIAKSFGGGGHPRAAGFQVPHIVGG